MAFVIGKLITITVIEGRLKWQEHHWHIICRKDFTRLKVFVS
uniref:Uncharacterized protein n=1 Tax=Anguilla anguilla TaxID=7936 RepID=A0A0E9ULT6_ANGAN